jgi:hypothetical protein
MRNKALLLALLIGAPAWSSAEVLYSVPENLSLSGSVDTRSYFYVGQDGETWNISSHEIISLCLNQEESQKAQAEIDGVRGKVEKKFQDLSEMFERRGDVEYSSVRKELGDGAILLAFSYESMFSLPKKRELRTQLEFYIFWKDNSVAKGTVIWVGKMDGKLPDYLKRLEATKKTNVHGIADKALQHAMGTKCTSVQLEN